MPLACIYHPFEKMRVVPINEVDKWVATGNWFTHPTEAKKVRDYHEEQIRRKSEQGSRNGKRKTKSPSDGTHAEG